MEGSGKEPEKGIKKSRDTESYGGLSKICKDTRERVG